MVLIEKERNASASGLLFRSLPSLPHAGLAQTVLPGILTGEVFTDEGLRFAVENQPGALAKVAAAFGEEKVNIDGISGTGAGDTGLICLVIDNPGKAHSVLQKRGVAFEEKEAVVRHSKPFWRAWQIP